MGRHLGFAKNLYRQLSPKYDNVMQILVLDDAAITCSTFKSSFSQHQHQFEWCHRVVSSVVEPEPQGAGAGAGISKFWLQLRVS
jgi:hypothetical protein